MQNLEKLTIVIPTYNRPEFVLRNMRYWSGKGCTVIVMDGSLTPIAESQLNGLAVNIQYVHSPVGLTERLLQACDMIQTPYASMLSDDDFFSEQGISEAIDELNENTSYACVNGNCASFLWKASEQQISTRMHYAEQAQFEMLQEQSRDRLLTHFRHYTPVSCYGVHRTAGFKLAMRAAAHKNSCIYSAELAFELVTAWLGKTKTIPHCYWLRSMENEPVNVPGSPRSFRFHHWYTDPKYVKEVESWYVHISAVLGFRPGPERVNFYRTLRQSCENFMDFCREYFAGQNRAERENPGCWQNTAENWQVRGVKVSSDIVEFLDQVKQFHMQSDHHSLPSVILESV
ncbi:TIGR00180 family glycosyltransferase [Rheinheimera texasensis]|uniref:TIGR00180 family glycosyltransferase n=1 Tax=Rheinheimera texasensis TaxID=306205 RepID=UPI0004E1F64C|nr:TIGR00180 family glycosyltransferase [Rheinheimera texasensis]